MRWSFSCDQKDPLLSLERAKEITAHFTHSPVLADWLPVTPTMCFCLRGAHSCAKPYYAQATEGGAVLVCVCVCVVEHWLAWAQKVVH